MNLHSEIADLMKENANLRAQLAESEAKASGWARFVAEMMFDPEQVKRAKEEIERGEYVTFDQLKAELRERKGKIPQETPMDTLRCATKEALRSCEDMERISGDDLNIRMTE